ncbi:phosphoribosyl-dephospho-CoA transferase MdcG domain-containing protein [Streptomyces sp. NRRL S-350]|uniref:phosphoribosyl-dephospho-CoA transferase MdcG domain-containing protein n=1 Tax=Streptomyces sp. NRRL S-350 TaxID=1463902 RepID=UPI00068B6000|nr:phosphoribosyl-dephospho-CoA transferase MdcG domain-containing protein [Streptomyces sp. NRRL S-350]
MTVVPSGSHARRTAEDPHGGPRRRVGPLAALDGRLPGAHDLLLMQCPGSLRPLAGGELPDWARVVLRTHPWVTVGRAPAVVGHPADLPHPERCTRDVEAAPEVRFPVTVRGPHPGQRLDALAPWAAVARTLRPEQLIGRRELLAPGRIAEVPALALLPEVGGLVSDHRLPWGPVGAVAYELAAGLPVTGPLTPLRLVLRAPQPVSRRDALQLWRALVKLPVPVQAELETRHGGVRLAEYAASPYTLTLQTPHGPREVRDPWFPRDPYA